MNARITQEIVEAPHIRSRTNVEAVMRYYEDPWERGHLGVLDETYTDDFIGHATGLPDFDLDGLRNLIVTYRVSFSDYRIRTDDIVAPLRTRSSFAGRAAGGSRLHSWGHFRPVRRSSRRESPSIGSASAGSPSIGRSTTASH